MFSLAHGLLGPAATSITHQDLQTWAGMDGWTIDFEEVIKLVQCERRDKKEAFSGDESNCVSKEEFVEFLKPKGNWMNQIDKNSEDEAN